MILFVFIGSALFIFFIDRKLKPIIIPYVNSEVERLTTNIVNNALKNMFSQKNISDNILVYEGNNYSYNTIFMNELANKASSFFYDEIMKLENGEIDDYFISKRIKNGKFNKIKKGIICDISFASLRESAIFANIGPSFPIKLLFLGDINTDYDFEVSEYGINNVLIKVFFVVKVREQVSMPFNSKKSEIVVRRLISMNIINGKVPEFLSSYGK